MIVNIYAFEDPVEWLSAWVSTQAKKGRGTARRLAQHLGVSTVLVSQILSGDRAIQPDHAFGIAEFCGLPANETDYLMLIVQLANAGTPGLREHLRKKVKAIQQSSVDLKNRIKSDVQLDEVAKAQFYSHWMYSAIRLLTDFAEVESVQDISARLHLPAAKVAEVLEFLVGCGLCERNGGRFRMAVQNTHLDSDSPWIYSRQMQWRNKAAQIMELGRKEDLFYTGPMSLSKKDRRWVRERLTQIIHEITDRARPSKSEDLLCLNVDFFSLL